MSSEKSVGGGPLSSWQTTLRSSVFWLVAVIIGVMEHPSDEQLLIADLESHEVAFVGEIGKALRNAIVTQSCVSSVSSLSELSRAEWVSHGLKTYRTALITRLHRLFSCR